MKSGKFDIDKARELADELLDFCAAEDEWDRRVAMTLKAACNEVMFLRREKQALWLSLCFIKNHGTLDPAWLKRIAADAVEEETIIADATGSAT